MQNGFSIYGGEKMKEILGNNLEQFFFVLDYPKEYVAICTYKSNRYEVWLMDDEIFDMISDMSEEKFVKFAGEDAWWRSSNGSVLYSLDKGEITINNQKFIGASMPRSVVACAIDLAKFNHLTMCELFEKYEPVED